LLYENDGEGRNRYVRHFLKQFTNNPRFCEIIHYRMRRNCVVSLKVGSSCTPEYTFKFVQANISKCIPRKFTHSNNLHIKKLQTEFNGALHTHVGVRSEKNSIKTYLLLSQHFHGGNQAFTILRENRKINILICTFCLVHSLKVQYHPRLNTTSILCVTLVNHKLHLK
jgi:hypothetical protein